jgi:undecaprenyl-diphosphatase
MERDATPPRPWAWLLVALLGAVLFGGAAEDLHEREDIAALDAPVAAALAPFGAPWFIGAMTTLSFLDSVTVVVPVMLVVAVYLAAKGHPRRAALGIVLVVGVNVLVQGVKLLIARPRPELALAVERGFSFPSGHTATAALLACLLVAWTARRFRGQRAARVGVVAALAWCIGVGLSRLVLGVHFFSDVVGGAGLGLVVGGLGLGGAESLRTLWGEGRRLLERTRQPLG